MKEFVVYTLLRALLFAATLGVVLGVWLLLAGHADLLVAVVIAFVVSGVGSYFLLQSPRQRFAQKVEARAEKATAAFDAIRAREDAERAGQAAEPPAGKGPTSAGG